MTSYADTMHRRRILPALILLSLAAAISPACSDSSCSVAGDAWPDRVGPFPPGPEGRPPHVGLRLGGAGGFEWSSHNGDARWRPIPREEVPTIVAIVETMNPQPYIVVEVEAGTDCATVRWLRRELDRLEMCREGRCMERSAWENYSEFG